MHACLQAVGISVGTEAYLVGSWELSWALSLDDVEVISIAVKPTVTNEYAPRTILFVTSETLTALRRVAVESASRCHYADGISVARGATRKIDVSREVVRRGRAQRFLAFSNIVVASSRSVFGYCAFPIVLGCGESHLRAEPALTTSTFVGAPGLTAADAVLQSLMSKLV